MTEEEKEEYLAIYKVDYYKNRERFEELLESYYAKYPHLGKYKKPLTDEQKEADDNRARSFWKSYVEKNS